MTTLARLYECRQALRFLHGEKYPTLIKSWKDGLRAVQGGRSILSAAIDAANRGAETDDVATMWIFAAAVELIEET